MKYLLFDSLCAVLFPNGSHTYVTVSKVLFLSFYTQGINDLDYWRICGADW